MYFITTKRMLEVCFSAHPNIQYRTFFSILKTVTCARSVQVILIGDLTEVGGRVRNGPGPVW